MAAKVGVMTIHPLIFGVPVYNEEGNVSELISNLAQTSNHLNREYRIVICNDGSSDGTVQRIEEHEEFQNGKVLLFNQPTNKGVARAFELIYKKVLALNDHWENGVLITLEGDNTSDLSILPSLLNKIENESCDVALASCYAKGGKILHTDPHRIYLSRIANLFVRIAFSYYGIGHIHTFSSFYRAHRLPYLRSVHEHYGEAFVSSEGFECMVETLARCAARGAVVGEVPMILDGSRRVGVTKLRIRKTIIGYIRLLTYLYPPMAVVLKLKKKTNKI